MKPEARARVQVAPLAGASGFLNRARKEETPMAVHFVCRSGDFQPTCLDRRRFDDATLLDWFRRVWAAAEDEDEAMEHAEEGLGGDFAFAFGPMFLTIAREGLPPPETMEDVAYVIASGDHHVAV
jgi:hypothetical protein